MHSSKAWLSVAALAAVAHAHVIGAWQPERK
jgi:hypothetical protein